MIEKIIQPRKSSIIAAVKTRLPILERRIFMSSKIFAITESAVMDKAVPKNIAGITRLVPAALKKFYHKKTKQFQSLMQKEILNP